jgi:hypothetical protein
MTRRDSYEAGLREQYEGKARLPPPHRENKSKLLRRQIS